MNHNAGTGMNDLDDLLFSDDAFLSAVAEAEARARSARAGDSGGRRKAAAEVFQDGKRMCTEGMSRPAGSPWQPQGGRSGAGVQCEDQRKEGEYMAALRGSNSDLWQSSGMGKGIAKAAAGFSNRAAPGNAVAGGTGRSSGSCYKCGMDGHWARECTGGTPVSGTINGMGNDAVAGGIGKGSGSCYKCGMDGHWARECTGGTLASGTINGMGNDTQGPPDVPERPCPCGAGACSVFTANTEKNQGRSFYRCPLPKDEGQCPYFEWCDSAGQINGTGVGCQVFNQQPQLDCQCGGGPCAILTAKTEKNMGRQFYKCPLPQGQGCSFFQWCDELGTVGRGAPSGVPLRPTNYSSNVNDPFVTGRSTSYGQGGHSAGDGPNHQPQTQSGHAGHSGQWTGTPASRVTGSCFKCGGQGHWSTSCPNVDNPMGQQYTNQGGVSNSGCCFKCGDPGHWASRCPTAVSGQR